MTPLQIDFGQHPLSLKEMAEQSIKKAIFEGQLEPETSYSDMQLAKTLGISKTPVREALIELASKGLLIHEARKGFKIRQLSQKGVKDLFHYRTVLELSILDMVIPQITDEEIDQLHEILSKNKFHLEQDSEFKQSIIADRHFHMNLVELSCNPFFKKAIEQVRDLCDLAGTWSLINVGRKYEAQKEHEKILDMIKLRDVEATKNKMEEHLSITCNTIIKTLERI